VQEHVHAADAQHGGIEVEPVEQAVVEMLTQLGIAVHLGILLANIFSHGHGKTAGARGRVAHHVFGRGRGHVHHQPDDMARGPELTVLSGAGDLAQHVLVEVALGVALGHVDTVKLIHHVGQNPGRGHHEQGVFHVVAVGGVPLGLVPAVAAQGLDERKHLITQSGEHLLRRGVLEPGPAQMLLVLSENRVFNGLAQPSGLAILEGVQLVQALDEQQIGQLLDDRKRVGDPAGPHRVPDAVNPGFEFAGDHVCSLCKVGPFSAPEASQSSACSLFIV